MGGYLEARLIEEIEAALDAPDPHVAAVHVHFATHYLKAIKQTEPDLSQRGTVNSQTQYVPALNVSPEK